MWGGGPENPMVLNQQIASSKGGVPTANLLTGEAKEKNQPT